MLKIFTYSTIIFIYVCAWYITLKFEIERLNHEIVLQFEPFYKWVCFIIGFFLYDAQNNTKTKFRSSVHSLYVFIDIITFIPMQTYSF